MADKVGAYNDQTIGSVAALYHDNGDGTFSLVGAVRILSGGAAVIGGVTVADGSDVTQGALADVAVITDTAGTISGKLRGLVKLASGAATDDLLQQLITLGQVQVLLLRQLLGNQNEEVADELEELIAAVAA